jgi:hypothetical protein
MPLTTDLGSGRRYGSGGERAGAVAFAGVLLVIVGLFHAIQGVVAIASEDFYTKTEEYIFQFSLATWGWIHLILGALVLAAGVGLFFGKAWARTIAVLAAAASLVGNFAWLPHHPIWGLSLMALDVFVIWAALMHGRDFIAE